MDGTVQLSENPTTKLDEWKTSFKFHLNDDNNTPDDCGRVFINASDYVNQKPIYLATEIESHIKPHQIGGVRFMFDNVIRDSGCILAHEMGLGKTLQIIALSDILLKYTTYKNILCIVPVNTIKNWENEFVSWLPTIKNQLFVVSDELTAKDRSQVILNWTENNGILLMGYEQYRYIAKSNEFEMKGKIKQQSTNDIYDGLIKTNVLVCDEGHRIKNEKSEINILLNKIRTKKRIILTGFPIQNHLKEYFCMG